MIQITIEGDACDGHKIAVVQIIQKALEDRRFVCALAPELQFTVGERDQMQARGHDILVKKGD